MKLHLPGLLVYATLILCACNVTLAQDVTPPPGYVPPTPAATLGPLVPAQAPGIENGALIFAEKCAPCHGETGMGDGEQGIQLSVPVTALGLPEIARPASPAHWYTVVTQGRMERLMPPFASLSDQERWDVVAYAMTLHTSEEEIAKGKELFESNCTNCPTQFFRDQATMSALSGVELARIVRQGNEQVPAFGSTLSEEDLWAVSAYLRTLSFDTSSIASAAASSATPDSGTAIETPAGTSITVPETSQPAASESTAVVAQGFGTVSGSVQNLTGIDLPADLDVTLRGYDHGADPNSGPQEVFSQEGAVEANGSFVFENIEMPLNRIFIAEISFEGIALQSGFVIVEAGDVSLTLPPIALYKKTEDTSALVMEEARIFFEYGEDVVQVFNVYSFRNTGDEIVIVKFNESGEIPFIKTPEGSSGFGYEPLQDSEPFQQIEDGVAIPPSENAYGLIAYSSLPRGMDFEVSQVFALPVPSVAVFVPDGITIESERSTDLGLQTMQDFNFHIYDLGSVTAGETLRFSLSGTPRETASADAASNQNLLWGAGALGITLILAGAWMYVRNRAETARSEADEENEFGSSDEVIEAILALDDLHRARKIAGEAYRKRRAELKEILKGML